LSANSKNISQNKNNKTFHQFSSSRRRRRRFNEKLPRKSTIEMPGTKRKRETKEDSKTAKKTDLVVDKPIFDRWLMKSEPESRIEKGLDVKFGIEDLKAEPDQTAFWDGVRNYQARNYMISMKMGQKSLFYHSNCKVPGITGIVEIVKESYVDHTQFDPKDPHYDPKSPKDNPRWKMVDVKFVRDLKRYISLPELKALHLEHKAKGGPLSKVALFTSARLSVQPLSQEEYDFIVSLENKKPPTK
jgi:predicted RNA-binding protein with PUA-like domain